jgi:predicted DNA-binding protein
MHGTQSRSGPKSSRGSAASRTGTRKGGRSSSPDNNVLRLSPQLRRALDRVVEKTGKRADYHVRKALEQYVEDVWDAVAAAEILKKSRRTYSSSEAKKLLGLDRQI